MKSYLFLAWVVLIYVQFSVSDVFISLAMASQLSGIWKLWILSYNFFSCL